MSLFTAFAVLVTVTALFSYLNQRFLRLPAAIGVMSSAMAASILLILSARLGFGDVSWAQTLLQAVDFDELLMSGMLSFLLFAGALHVNIGDLLERKWSILSLATLGVFASTLLVGTATWFLLGLLGLRVPYVWALLFGALISPTDPIAVLGLLKRARTPRTLEALITGESLFNDGVGVVLFIMVLGFTAGGHDFSLAAAGELFLIEAIGGVAFGFALGWISYLLLRGVDQHVVEILITLAVVSGGYALANALHTSGPLAMVVAGLFVGNHGRVFGMSEESRAHLDSFWEVADEILNAVLFVLIGLEILVLDLEAPFLLAGALAVPLILGVRLATVGLAINALRTFRSFPPFTVMLMTWGGLRGGISIALALSLPASAERDLILVMTYVVVVFSILVQGLTVGRLARWTTSR